MTRHPACHPFRQTLLATALLAAFSSAGAHETTTTTTTTAADENNPARVVVLGSRSSAKTALDTAAPVGLINVEKHADRRSARTRQAAADARSLVQFLDHFY